MTHKGIIKTTLFAAALISPSVFGAQVVSENVRQRHLAEMERVFDAPLADLDAMLQDCRDPFFPVVASIAKRSANEEEVAEVVDFGQVLESVGASLKVTGVMVRGSRSMIVASGGPLYKVGETFSMEINGQQYQITLQAADNDGYTISTETENLTIPFMDGPAFNSAPQPQ